MGQTFLIFQLLAVFCLTVFLLNKYGNWRKQHFIVSISTLIGWYFSFLIVVVLPLDLSMTFYEKCRLDKERLNLNFIAKNTTFKYSSSEEFASTENRSFDCEVPKGHVPEEVLLGLWRVIYWTSQFLTWIVLPLMQSYSKAGEFTAIGRFKSAIYNNAIYYGIYAFIFIILLFYAISKGVSLNFDHLKVLVISVSNTWGLFLLVLLLGYGLVEVPRQLWQMSSRNYRLSKIYFDIDKLSTDRNDAEETIQEVYREAREVMNVLKSTRGSAREKSQQIMSKFPPQLSKLLNSLRMTPNFGNASNITQADASVISNEAYLIRLHKRVIEAVQNHHRCQAQWGVLITKALYLEDVELAEATMQIPQKWTTLSYASSSSLGPSNSLLQKIHIPHSICFSWHVYIKRHLLQLFGIIFAAMTFLIIWSECTFFIVRPQLSLVARILHGAAHGNHYKYIQISAVLLIFYLSICAYYTIFRLRIYRYYHLDANHMTDENSLIFSAMLLCRLTAPICLNFLGMAHLDSHITSNSEFGVETQFTKLMGHLDVITVLAKGLNIYLPILIMLLCLGTWFRLGTRFLHMLGIEQFLDEDQMISGMVQGGKSLVTLERNRLNRERGREMRNRAWQAKNGPKDKGRSLGRKEYDDREPIIEHQDNPNEDFELNHLNTENETLLFAVPSSNQSTQPQLSPFEAQKIPPSPLKPSSMDLEFRDAFSSINRTSTNLSENSSKSRNDTKHPTPSSIFDDL